jgi:hypothetical protein
MSNKNRLAAALLLITVVLILLIAAGIPNLELQPGQRYVLPTTDDSPGSWSRGGYASGEGLLFLMRFLFAIAIVLLPFFPAVFTIHSGRPAALIGPAGDRCVHVRHHQQP